MCENEFRAIVLAAGSGSRMRVITSEKPKCLLPVGNLPLIWYPLSMLEQAGFTSVTVIVLEEEQGEIKRTLEKLLLKLSLKFISIKMDDDLGTGDALRKVSKNHEQGALIISCDLITDMPLEDLFNLHRKHEAHLTAFLFPCIPDPTPGSFPGPKSKQKPDRDLVGLDPATSRLILLASGSDFEESLDLRMRLLRKHKRIELHSRLSDAHLYVISSALWKYITTQNSDPTLKGEILPYIVSQQMSHCNKFQESKTEEDLKDSNARRNELFKCFPPNILQKRIEELTSWSDDLREGMYHGDRLRCFAFLSKNSSSARVNTIPAYWHMCKQVLNAEKWTQIVKVRPLVRVDPSVTLKSKKLESCLVGAGSQILENCKLVNSCIGSNCTIEAGATITDCVLMNNVLVKKGATLTNSLLCDGSIIEEQVTLKSCLVGSNYNVANTPESCYEHEILASGVMETF